ncbi:MAG: DUF4924 family protein [Pseudoflavonifractor sp.]|nr:DUF4924 family protein [Alloprevotella sp.]MCM1116990.1 DUF4924 family protein [Pseudoflavonifractor sp.]
MIIASAKRKENIAEYILYMWQVEDIIRANDLDIDKIKANVIDRFPGLSPDARREMTEWYESLIDMMRREGVAETGHLQINRNILADLAELHRRLLADPRFPDYTALFYKALPFIVELRSKGGDAPAGEIETCFNALYGMLLLRLGSKEVTPATQEAIKAISTFIAALARDYHLDEANRLFPADDDKPS